MAIPLQNIPPLVKASTTSCTLAATYEGAQSILRIGGKYYRLSAQLTLNTGTTGLGGLDTGALGASQTWYVYACANTSGVVGLVASLTGAATGPTGFSGRYNLVGQFTTTSGSLIDAVTSISDPANIAAGGPASTGAWVFGPNSGNQNHRMNGYLELNSPNSSNAIIQYMHAGSVLASLGASGAGTITGSATGDFTFVTNSKPLRFSANNGSTEQGSLAITGAWTWGPSGFTGTHRINGVIGAPSSVGGSPVASFMALAGSGSQVGAGTITIDITLPGATTDYAQGIISIGGNAFNGSNPIRSTFNVGGRKDLGLVFTSITNTLPTGITSITVTQPSTHVIGVSIASTAPSAEGRVLFTGSIA